MARSCSSQRWLIVTFFLGSAVLLGGAPFATGTAQKSDAPVPPQSELQQAARQGDLTAIESSLSRGADPNAKDDAGRTALMEAVRAGQADAVRVLVGSGADPNLADLSGRTALIEAAEHGYTEAARILIEGGADLDRSQRGVGTPLEAAERLGHDELAALLRDAGARTFGKSVGDTVCVRPWDGDGYCGVVEQIRKTAYRIHITSVVGCTKGCAARADCSAGRPVGGKRGLAKGDTVRTASWCLTHTGVEP